MKKYEIEEIQKHKPKYKQMIFVQRPFGIEIEVGNIKTNPVKTSSFSETIYDGTHNLFPNRKLYKTSWQYVKDRSIDEYRPNSDDIKGYEFVSPVLTDTKETWQTLKNLCLEIKEKNYLLTNRCGAHVHLDATGIAENPEHLIRLYKLWIAYEDIIYKFGYFGDSPRASIARYSVPLSAYLNNTLELLELAQGKSYKTVLDYLYLAKYSAINIMNLRDELLKPTGKNTIEFRCANGTIIPLNWQLLVKLYQTIYDYSISNNFDEQYIDYMLSKQTENIINADINIDKAQDFANLIFNKDEDKKDFMYIYAKRQKTCK